MEKKFALFARGEVGLGSLDLFVDNPDQLRFVILNRDNMWKRNDEIIARIDSSFPNTEYFYAEGNEKWLVDKCKEVDCVLLAYWGVIKEPLLSAPRWGFINQHPSLLPYGQGSHAHMWSIVERSPFGCSIMKISAELDKGDILFQKKLDVDWTDTGHTLYYRGIQEQIKLLLQHKTEILNLDLECKPQAEGGTFHYRREMKSISHIDLDKEYTARELLNLLRAKTFSPFPGLGFEEDGRRYEARIKINEVIEDFDSEKIDYSKIRILDSYAE